MILQRENEGTQKARRTSLMPRMLGDPTRMAGRPSNATGSSLSCSVSISRSRASSATHSSTPGSMTVDPTSREANSMLQGVLSPAVPTALAAPTMPIVPAMPTALAMPTTLATPAMLTTPAALPMPAILTTPATLSTPTTLATLATFAADNPLIPIENGTISSSSIFAENGATRNPLLPADNDAARDLSLPVENRAAENSAEEWHRLQDSPNPPQTDDCNCKLLGNSDTDNEDNGNNDEMDREFQPVGDDDEDDSKGNAEGEVTYQQAVAMVQWARKAVPACRYGLRTNTRKLPHATEPNCLFAVTWLHLQFLELIKDRKDGTQGNFFTKVSPFSLFGDRSGYAGFVPTASYFHQFYDCLIESWAPEMEQRISLLSARVLSVDHSFKFGHEPTESIYTDNVRADKRELEWAFPSLLHNITPVPVYSNLETVALPPNWSVIHLTSTHQVNTWFNVIMNHQLSGSSVTVGFEMEWPVNISAGTCGPVALIQIAYQKSVYLIKTLPYVQDGVLHLPQSLLTFLRSPLYTKVGVNISADSKKLQADCGFSAEDTPFSGQIELATLLHRSLLKDATIHVSPHWGDAELHPDFIKYAALDAYTTWEVYSHLSNMGVLQFVTSDTPGGTPATLFLPDGKEVASGIITLDHVNKLHGIEVTKSRVTLTISAIHVPAYLHPAALCPGQKATALSALGALPFSIVAYARQVRTSESLVPRREAPASSSVQGQLASQDYLFKTTEITRHDPGPVIESGILDDLDDSEQPDTVDGDIVPSQTVEESVRDPVAEAALRELLLQYEDPDISSQDAVRSRVLGDIWHLHDQFPISQHHDLHQPFARALSAAIFIPNAEDKVVVEAILGKLAVSYNSKILSKPHWVLHRIRHHIPSPEVLLPRVTAIIKMYGPLKDSTTNLPLFNEKAWDIAKNVLENIHQGYYSDPPGVQLYYKVGVDKRGLNLYRCCCGTNDVEGGVHQNLIRFTSFNISPRHVVCVCSDPQAQKVDNNYVAGSSYIGHFDIPLKNQVASMLDILSSSDVFDADVKRLHGSWLNGNDYARVNEDSDTPYARVQPPRHHYLSKRQGTQFAVLPVHTREERDLFQLFVDLLPLFKMPGQPNWDVAAAVWSNHADGRKIFYKLPEHIKSYYKTWNEHCNENNSVALNIAACARIRALVHPQPGSAPSIPAATPLTLEDALKASPTVNYKDYELNPWIIDKILAEHQTYQSAVQYWYAFSQAPTDSANSSTGAKCPAENCGSSSSKRRRTLGFDTANTLAFTAQSDAGPSAKSRVPLQVLSQHRVQRSLASEVLPSSGSGSGQSIGDRSTNYKSMKGKDRVNQITTQISGMKNAVPGRSTADEDFQSTMRARTRTATERWDEWAIADVVTALAEMGSRVHIGEA
ncbi:hypothetical protein BKA93DRAFT_747778 [Sparassis latifolia]